MLGRLLARAGVAARMYGTFCFFACYLFVSGSIYQRFAICCSSHRHGLLSPFSSYWYGHVMRRSICHCAVWRSPVHCITTCASVAYLHHGSVTPLAVYLSVFARQPRACYQRFHSHPTYRHLLSLGCRALYSPYAFAVFICTIAATFLARTGSSTGTTVSLMPSRLYTAWAADVTIVDDWY